MCALIQLGRACNPQDVAHDGSKGLCKTCALLPAPVGCRPAALAMMQPRRSAGRQSMALRHGEPLRIGVTLAATCKQVLLSTVEWRSLRNSDLTRCRCAAHRNHCELELPCP